MLVVLLAFAAAFTKPARAQSDFPRRARVAQDLARKLRAYPLGRYAWVLEAAGWRYHVNPYMIAAIAKLESTYGLAACGSDLWGYNSCHGHPWGSVQDGIFYVTARIRSTYMTEWGLRDVWSIGNKWCTCGSHYGVALAAEMSRLGSPLRANYP